MARAYRYKGTLVTLDGQKVKQIKYRVISPKVITSELSWNGRMNSGMTQEIATLDNIPEAVLASPGNYRLMMADGLNVVIKYIIKQEISPILSSIGRKYEHRVGVGG